MNATTIEAIRGYSRTVPKPWGYEVVFTPDSQPYTGKVLHVAAGRRLSLQIHDLKVETMLLLSGEAVLELEDDAGVVHSIAMMPGEGHSVPAGRLHRLCGITDAIVFEVSTPECGRTIRVADDYGRMDERTG